MKPSDEPVPGQITLLESIAAIEHPDAVSVTAGELAIVLRDLAYVMDDWLNGVYWIDTKIGRTAEDVAAAIVEALRKTP